MKLGFGHVYIGWKAALLNYIGGGSIYQTAFSSTSKWTSDETPSSTRDGIVGECHVSRGEWIVSLASRIECRELTLCGCINPGAKNSWNELWGGTKEGRRVVYIVDHCVDQAGIYIGRRY